MITLRTLQKTDIDLIRQWPPYTGDMQQMDYALRYEGWLDEFWGQPDVFLFAGMDEEELVGFAILIITAPSEAEFRIALRADKTGQRLGEIITSLTLLKAFEELDLSNIHLIVRKTNSRGIRLYQRLGFKSCGNCSKKIKEEWIDFIQMEINEKYFSTTDPKEDTTMQTTTRRALIVIDVQNDYIGGRLPIVHPPVEQSLANIGRVMDAARSAGIPVVAVQNILPEGAPFMAKGTPGAELHPVVTSRGWDHYLLKDMPSAFCKTGLETWLQEQQINTITVVGYMTHNCDLSTAIAAMHRGFQVEFLSDATGSLPYANTAGSATAEEIHRVMTVVMQARFAAVLTTDEWLEAIASGRTPERDTIFASNQRARKGA